MDWFEQTSPLIVSVVPTLSVKNLSKAGLADRASDHDQAKGDLLEHFLQRCPKTSSLWLYHL